MLATSRLGRRLALASTILFGGPPAMAIDVAPLWKYSDPAGSELIAIPPTIEPIRNPIPNLASLAIIHTSVIHPDVLSLRIDPP